MTSCRGKSHREDMPHVAFYATKKTARKLVELLQDQPVGIWNASIEGFNGLALYARRASSLLEFSKILSENRDSFGWA